MGSTQTSSKGSATADVEVHDDGILVAADEHAFEGSLDIDSKPAGRAERRTVPLPKTHPGQTSSRFNAGPLPSGACLP